MSSLEDSSGPRTGMLERRLVVIFRRIGHARSMSAYSSTSDLLAAMSESLVFPSSVPSGPDVTDSPSLRGLLTHCGRL